jgi:hypothetical protein
MKKVIFILFVLFMELICLGSDVPGKAADLVDLEKLCSGGDDWKVVDQKIQAEKGRIQLYTDKWLMFFLHWRPLKHDLPPVSVKTVKHLLLNLWGPSMPFEIEGDGGETEVAGHRAFFIDGTIYNGKIRTRFVVWDCSQSGRRFIADCNINQGRGTAQKWLRLQLDMVGTISCHGDRLEETHNALLTDVYQSPELKISFARPSDWRTSLYESKEWYPKGQSVQKGSLWTLVTTANKIIQVDWMNRQELPDREWKGYLKKISGSTFKADQQVESRIIIDTIGEIRSMDGRLLTKVSFTLLTRYQGKDIKQEYSGYAVSWVFGGQRISVLAAIVNMQSVWEQPFSLTPSDKTLRNYLEMEVLPAIRRKKK